jgi:hypothetical protein
MLGPFAPNQLLQFTIFGCARKNFTPNINLAAPGIFFSHRYGNEH